MYFDRDELAAKPAAERLAYLRGYAGLTRKELALLCGFKGPSGLQRYEDPHQFHKRYFAQDLTLKFADALTGKGTPPLQRGDILYLLGALSDGAAVGQASGMPDSPVIPVVAGNPGGLSDQAPLAQSLSPPAPEAASVEIVGGGEEVHLNVREWPKNLSVLGTAAGSNGDGAMVMDPEPIETVRRPPRLLGVKGAYAIYVVGDSMDPRHKAGELRYVHPRLPVRPGDDVIVQVSTGEHDPIQAYIKELVRVTPDTVICRQYNPADDAVVFKKSTVLAIHKIPAIHDLMGF